MPAQDHAVSTKENPDDGERADDREPNRAAGAGVPFSVPDRLVVDPTYGELRETEPMTRVKLPYGEEAWLATRYEDVRTVLGDVRFGRAPAVQRDEPRLTRASSTAAC
ncbi:hypothetical protein NKG94_22475 [Micromonospora sp. M12]